MPLKAAATIAGAMQIAPIGFFAVVHLAQQALDVGSARLRLGAGDREVAQVLRRAEATGEDQRVEVRGRDLGHVGDLAAAMRADSISTLRFSSISSPLRVVDHVHLIATVRRHAAGSRPPRGRARAV